MNKQQRRRSYTPDTLNAVARWRVGLPVGPLCEVDRTMIAALLTFGSALDDDAAVQVSLVLVNRVVGTIRNRITTSRMATDISLLRDALAALDGAQQSLTSI